VASQRTQVGGSWTRTGLPAAINSATYNGANQQTAFGGATLTYDQNGNLTGDGTNTYTWDARNRLASISGPVPGSFVYDAFGRRQRKTIDGTITDFVYDGVNPVRQAVGASTVDLLTGMGIDEYLMRTDASSSRDPLSDAFGSTVSLSDASGTVQTEYSYEAFGTATVSGSASTNELRYTGREEDGTGLDYYRARYYHPGLQRFISEDPIGFAGGDANLYTYVFNAPLDFTDSSGMAIDPISWTAAGIACGGGAILGGAYTSAAARLSGRKATWSELGHGAALGCGTGMLALVSWVAAAGAGAVIVADEGVGVALNAAQALSLQRFMGRLPNGAGTTRVRDLPGGSRAFQAAVPARDIPGSHAVYEKQVDAAGKTLEFTKTVFDPAGLIVNMKDKIRNIILIPGK
jgi:RHS repeat-associated protein